MNPFAPGAPLLQRWFTFPAGVAAVSGIVAGFSYGIWMMAMPPRWIAYMWIAAFFIAGLTVSLAEVRARRYLAVWKKISTGALPASAEHLRTAARDAHGLPERLFMSRLVSWWVLGVIVAGWLYLASDWATGEDLFRVALLAFLLGPVICLAPHFAMVRRTRVLVEEIAARGLTAQDMAEAIPPARLRLRGRLLVFGLIAAGVPALMVADAATGRSTEALDRIANIDDPVLRREQAAAAIFLLRAQVVGVALALLGVVAVLAAGVGRAIAAPLHRMSEAARRVADGKLTEPRAIVAEAEVWTLSVAFAQMEAQLSNLLSQLRRAGVQISSTTEQIVVTSSKHESGAARQASALTQTSSTTEELARSARSIAANAQSVAQIAQQTLQSAELARTNAVTFSEAMERMRRGNQAIADSVASLNARLGQIGKIIEFINGIADKSDLLALNAELEGVKAGEVGRAFSLVATEMRRMAENVTRSTSEIAELIDQIRDASIEAVRVTEAGMATTESSSGIVQSLSESLSRIVSLAGQTSEAVKTISSSTQQQQAGTDQLAGAMSDILSVTQETEAATQAIIVANVDLVRLARELEDAVTRFDLSSAAGAPTATPQA